MFDFSNRAKIVYKSLRLFEFNTGESATDDFEDLPIEEFAKWLTGRIPISIDINKSITELIDEIFVNKMPQYFEESFGYEEYIPLAVLSIYLSETIDDDSFLLGPYLYSEEVGKIVKEEINELDKILSYIGTYYSNINKFN